MYFMSHVLRFIFFFKRFVSSCHAEAVLFKYQGRLDMTPAELCGHYSQPPLMTVLRLFNHTLGGSRGAEITSHVLINLHLLKDDVSSLPVQPQDLFCCVLRLADRFFIVWWMLAVLE